MYERKCTNCLYSDLSGIESPCRGCIKDPLSCWKPADCIKLDADKLAETAETVTRQFFDGLSKMPDQTAKQDAGKLQITLVPTQIIRDIAEVRMYGNKKYGSADNWKNVEPVRYRDALMRHLLAYVDDPKSIDAESGLPHLWHAACNMAFLCEMEVHDDD